MRDDSGRRACFLATLGFNQWRLRDEYQDELLSDPEDAGADAKVVRVRVSGLAEPLMQDLTLAMALLGLGVPVESAGRDAAVEIIRAGQPAGSVDGVTLATAEGKRRLWRLLGGAS
ncbi:hypothetical protein FCL40_09245 [Ferrimonas sediminicola]|uniref:Uncharacterized protein n=1 Tax=Ferrimonas sediminicola TaxID=2569538 RepID=A0A4U1BEM5_9GAMM|nr:hypothetical protein [Ferrimonas sediminicola]TKB49496.1 hypothetical protein FCL40_09245 [Ferrimonas sediminicola]